MKKLLLELDEMQKPIKDVQQQVSNQMTLGIVQRMSISLHA